MTYILNTMPSAEYFASTVNDEERGERARRAVIIAASFFISCKNTLYRHIRLVYADRYRLCQVTRLETMTQVAGVNMHGRLKGDGICLLRHQQGLAYKDYKAVTCVKVKSKVFPYSLPSVGPGADPGVQAVSPQVT